MFLDTRLSLKEPQESLYKQEHLEKSHLAELLLFLEMPPEECFRLSVFLDGLQGVQSYRLYIIRASGLED